MLRSLSPARRRFVLASVVIALLAVVAVVVTVASKRTSTDPVAQDEPGPVLLVPGYGGSTSALRPLVRALEDEGRTAVVVVPPGQGRGSLRTQAENLAKVATRERARAGASSVDVIGYSAGGVVARLWVKELGGADVVRRVLTLGSPHHGTDVASLAEDVAPGACPVACQQLDPDSGLLAALNAGDETPSGPVYISIWSADDEVVTPPESADLVGALDFTVQSVCSGTRVSHGQLPGDRVVLAALPTVLGKEAPVAPKRSACAQVSS